MASGPLAGTRIIEMAGIGPAPFACMVLADMGAEVIRIDRPGGDSSGEWEDATLRGRAARLALDLKNPEAVAALRTLVRGADALIEGFRPGVMERLGLGPEALLAENPGLVFTRITGWGQDGPLSDRAGHDINYISLSGALHAIGGPEAPVVPLNLIGDYGGGAMLGVVGLLAALVERGRSGRGQVVDAAMTDGAALLMALLYGLKAKGSWQDRREANLLDGAAPFYGIYACADGRHLSVGPLEPQFHAEFLRVLGIDAAGWPQMDRAQWPAQKARLAEIFSTRSRDDWVAAFEGTDACIAPVLSMTEAPDHPHNRARGTFTGDFPQPAPAPRFDRTPSAIARHDRPVTELLQGWGLTAEEIAGLVR
ncbi:MAG: CaiB/BaiF CoA-transferase family protein [Gemmobacter sp.]